METEIEAKFLDVDHDILRNRLQEFGAQRIQPMRLMRRQTYDIPGGKNWAWARVRDEGDKITMSYKHMEDRTLHGTKEICLTVDSFDMADAFLRAVGLIPGGYQETKRECWLLDGVEIDLDVWPWLKPYAEIEGPSEKKVTEVATLLGFDMQTATHGGVEIAYMAEYEVEDGEVIGIQRMTFEEAIPDWLEKKRRLE